MEHFYNVSSNPHDRGPATTAGIMRTVALEMGPRGIRCNSVNPGMVETALIGSFTEEQKEKERANYPLGRFARPEDIANGIVYLLSDASSFVTGTALKIDGGMTLA